MRTCRVLPVQIVGTPTLSKYATFFVPSRLCMKTVPAGDSTSTATENFDLAPTLLKELELLTLVVPVHEERTKASTNTYGPCDVVLSKAAKQ